jgi:hypothetical protein
LSVMRSLAKIPRERDEVSGKAPRHKAVRIPAISGCD